MAIVTEFYRIREDGVTLNRTYSDAGFKIERDGVRYSEAIDPAELGRSYTETDEPIVDTDVESVDGLNEVNEPEDETEKPL